MDEDEEEDHEDCLPDPDCKDSKGIDENAAPCCWLECAAKGRVCARNVLQILANDLWDICVGVPEQKYYIGLQLARSTPADEVLELTQEPEENQWELVHDDPPDMVPSAS